MIHRTHGALLLEVIFALAIFVVAGTTVILILRSGVAEIRRATDAQRALDHAASAVAQLEAGLRSVQDLVGEIPEYDPGDGAESFENAPPEPTAWRLDIDTQRSEITGLLVLTVTATLDVDALGNAMLARATQAAPAASATLTTLVPLDRAEPPDENPDDALQALFDEEAL